MKKFQRLLRRRVLGVIALALMVGFIAAPGANAASISDLGNAGPAQWAVLTLDGGVSATNYQMTGSTINGLPGNVGVVTGNASVSGSTVSGALFLSTGGSLSGDATQFAGGVNPAGQAAADAKLSAAATDAASAKTIFEGLAVDQAKTNAGTPSGTTISPTNVGGLTVVSFDTISFTGSKFWTFDGGGNSASQFIVKIADAGILSLLGSSGFKFSGISPFNVLFFYEGTNTDVITSNLDTGGILFFPNAQTALDNNTADWTGELIGKTARLTSHSTLVPLPPSAFLLGSGLLGLGLLGGRKQWFRKS